MKTFGAEAVKDSEMSHLKKMYHWVLLITWVLVGCGTSKIDDFSGMWVLSSDSFGVLRTTESSDAASTINLNPSGQFSAERVPAEMVGAEQAQATPVSGSGDWRLSFSNGKVQVYLTFRKISSRPETLEYGQPLEVSGLWSPKRLYYFVGDPDEGHVVSFRRR